MKNHDFTYLRAGTISTAILCSADHTPRTVEELRLRAGRELPSVPTHNHVTSVAWTLLRNGYFQRGGNPGSRYRTFMITPLGLRAAAAVQTRLTHHEAVVLFLIGGVRWQSIHLLSEKLEAHKQMKPASARASAYNALKRLAEAGLVEYGRAKARLTALGLYTLPDAELYVRCAG